MSESGTTRTGSPGRRSVSAVRNPHARAAAANHRPDNNSRLPVGRPTEWSAEGGRFRAGLQVISGVAVVALEGHLNRESIPVCRSAVEASLRLRTEQVVLDLREAQVDEESRPVLALLDRITSRRGVSLWLAGLSVPARGLLRTDRTATYRIFPTVLAARNEAAALAHRRRY